MITQNITLNTTIQELAGKGIVTVRFRNVFDSIPGFVTLGDILKNEKPDTELLRYRNMGRRTLNELKEIRNAYSYLLDLEESCKPYIPPTYEEVKDAYSHYRKLHELYLLHTLRGTNLWNNASKELDKRLAIDGITELCGLNNTKI